jgi:D-alanyl-D-alanine carboxypeptidase (penicillin-binding protein 5/6)
MKKAIKFLFPIFLLICFFLGAIFFQRYTEKFFYAQISQPFESIAEVKIIRPKKPELNLQAKSAISVRIGGRGEKVLFKKDIDETLPIASLTKLMTAIVVFEEPSYNISDLITVSKIAADQEDVPNYGNLKMGERFRKEKLLELMLIYSSNDAAQALSEVIGTDKFVEKMNEKAKEIGTKNTYFVNPTGLDENHEVGNHATAQDLVKISQYILREHPEIFEMTLKEGLYPVANGFLDLTLLENQKIIGGKTGYTEMAGGCMIFIFKNESGSIYINVMLGAGSVKARIEEMQKLIDWLNT